MSERRDEHDRLAAVPRQLNVSRGTLSVLAEQQAALRRVATLVARGVSPPELFSAVADEMAGCLHASNASVARFNDDGTLSLLALGRIDPRVTNTPSVGARFSLEGHNIAATVLRTGRAARLDSSEHAPGPVAAQIRAMGFGCTVGAPITVDGRVWGMATLASSASEPLPADTEARIGDFADLVATAIANAATRDELQASRDQLHDLAEQQAALRRVATLVARGIDPSELFKAVAKEMAHCLGAELTAVWRYEPDHSSVPVASSEDPELLLPVGVHLTLEGENVLAMVLDSGRAARQNSVDMDNATGSAATLAREIGTRTTVGAPIFVDGRVWGMAGIGSTSPEPPPSDTEARLCDFADLVATAIANAAARDELRASRDKLGELAEQQAALRRVATLVAQGVNSSELLNAVANEVAQYMDVDNAAVMRFEPDGAVVIVAGRYQLPADMHSPVGERFSLEGDNIAARVLDTGRAARMDTHDNAAGTFAARTREMGIHCRVGVPIVVDGRVWGLATVSSATPEPLPATTEERLADFADLVATAIANAATRDELIASRARIVAAADDARRRIERDLHDGAQQRLVSLGLQLRLAEDSVRPEQHDVKQQLAGVMSGLTAVSSELQQISRGIHPAILSKGGLGPALKTLARRCPVPVSLDVAVERRLPEPVEVAAYYVVAEALTNTAKYAKASELIVCAETNEGALILSIQDDGIGGADSRKGSGLIGLKDRVEVLGGDMKIASHPGSGTSLHITIPLDGGRP